MKKEQKYYNILTTEGAAEATILLYGYIGDARDWYTGEQLGVTDVVFVQELDRLAAKYNTIHVRINSPGGEIFHGSAIVTALRNCKAEVNTWIDGVAASMAGVIWMAGKKRHMAKNGMLMIHAASGLCWGNAADMREMAGTLEAFDQSLVTSCASSLGMSEEDMKKKYFDGKDHWLTWNDVNGEGWLSEPDDYQAAAPLPEDITKMSLHDLVAYFDRQKQPDGGSLFQRLFAAWNNALAAVTGGKQNHIHSQSELEIMNLKEFQDSLADGTLKLDEVKAHLASLEPPAPPATPEPAPAPAESPELVALKAQIEELKNTISAWGKAPGEGKTTPAVPGEDLPTADGAQTLKARIEAAARMYNKAAETNEPAQFVIAQ